ncbi:hypothetical protein L1987_10418 [Smallanthus sonchifolius]|uniref:Uncharacterized protein n=1 Tax=Smallanthus sonchifolius TaxID=185202 RepID=A0ACB9JS58_9ASTR|nr:hypothetical protein L1987_10418 [Smallanthus sonchifolius]
MTGAAMRAVLELVVWVPGLRKKCKRKGVFASLFGVGAPEALVIGVVALFIFGPKGLAEGRPEAVGGGLKMMMYAKGDDVAKCGRRKHEPDFDLHGPKGTTIHSTEDDSSKLQQPIQSNDNDTSPEVVDPKPATENGDRDRESEVSATDAAAPRRRLDFSPNLIFILIIVIGLRLRLDVTSAIEPKMN